MFVRNKEGDLIYVPPGEVHGIENLSDGGLTHVSAATPALDAEAAYDTGQLRERPDDERGSEKA